MPVHPPQAEADLFGKPHDAGGYIGTDHQHGKHHGIFTIAFGGCIDEPGEPAFVGARTAAVDSMALQGAAAVTETQREQTFEAFQGGTSRGRSQLVRHCRPDLRLAIGTITP